MVSLYELKYCIKIKSKKNRFDINLIDSPYFHSGLSILLSLSHHNQSLRIRATTGSKWNFNRVKNSNYVIW